MPSQSFVTNLRANVTFMSYLLVLWVVSVARPAESTSTSRQAPNAASYYAQILARRPSVSGMTSIGKALFNDASLSSSGTLSCASCHNPSRAFGPDNDLPVQRGGTSGRESGIRAVPSLRYLQSVPPFTEHFFESDGNDSEDQGPAGGRTWDGRSQSAHDQAKLPLLSPLEMGNSSAEAIVARVKKSAYAERIRETFGQDVFDSPQMAFNAILMTLEVYQQSPSEFYPYSSKYDAWLRRKASLSEQEARGLAIFNDPAKGNCGSCHPSGIKNGAFPTFTDYGYIALGVPRNSMIPANVDPRFYDLGLCGPLRSDLSGRAELCGLFRTPSLRNVAMRPVFFHNGSVKRLEDAVRFYATRDSRPEDWFPRGADGSVRKFDDLPDAYVSNIENKVPFGRKPGDAPALTDAEIEDITAFLRTLTDGWSSEQ